ncbi:MAG TPA: putative sulfate exporter family transporter [Terriglobales bacterium]|nr:putative sulfate exporter family transporter [Terriglobales bacterium]
MTQKIFFFLGLAAAASGFASPPVALTLGLIFGLGFSSFGLKHPYSAGARKSSRFLLQASVVGLGFGMNLHEVIRVGRSGFLYTLLSISFTMVAGMALASAFRVERRPAFLISTGTAICGGSAIAAVGPITHATDEEMAISLGTVFVLNSVALLTFPFFGSALHLTQTQFGLWAALAIHDTSSVVGAAAKYGAAALAVGTTVKLARALWIVPVALATAVLKGAKAKIQWPWFIGFFCLAAVCNTYLSAGAPVYAPLVKLAKIGLTVTLYLIGSGISVVTLKEVGHRPLLQGVTLWLLVSFVSLWLIRAGWIAL